MTEPDGDDRVPSVTGTPKPRRSVRGRPTVKRKAGPELREATRAECLKRFVALQREYGVRKPATWTSSPGLAGFKDFRLRSIQTESEAVRIWRAMKPLIDKARELLLKPEAEPRGGRCAQFLRSVVVPIHEDWNWEEPDDGRAALLSELDEMNVLRLPPAAMSRGLKGQALEDFHVSQYLRAKDIAVISLLLELSWPLGAGEFTPADVIWEEAKRFDKLIASAPQLPRGPRCKPIVSPRAGRPKK